jgi:hypothetical protein
VPPRFAQLAVEDAELGRVRSALVDERRADAVERLAQPQGPPQGRSRRRRRPPASRAEALGLDGSTSDANALQRSRLS